MTCDLSFVCHTALVLTGSLKICGTVDGKSYSSALLPELTVRLEHEGQTIHTCVTESLRQFQFFDLELNKTYTVHVGMTRAIWDACCGCGCGIDDPPENAGDGVLMMSDDDDSIDKVMLPSFLCPPDILCMFFADLRCRWRRESNRRVSIVWGVFAAPRWF